MEVLDQIFLHCNKTELLDVSQVTTHWEKFIGSSTCMNKIKVKVSDKQDEDDLGVIAKTTRKYLNLEINQPKHIEEVLKIAANPNCSWRKVSLKLVRFESPSQLAKFFNIIELNVKELILEEVSVGDEELSVSFEGLTFPKLEILRFEYVPSWISQAFVGCSQIKKLSVRFIERGHEVKRVKTIMAQNNLTELVLADSAFEHIFREDIAMEFSFKLKTFISKNLFRYKKTYKAVNANFNSFLQTQTATLETISVGEWTGEENFKLMFESPNLKSFSANGLRNLEKTSVVEWTELKLKCNNSIQKLCLKEVETFDVMKAIIVAAPNVNELEMHSMNQPMMEYLSSKAKHLKSLKLRVMAVNNLLIQELFLHLEILSCDIVGEELLNHLEVIPESEQSEFVKMINKLDLIACYVD